MIPARALAFARIAFACVVALAIALAPPDLERLFASFARADLHGTSNDPGWLGHALANVAYVSPWHYGAIAAGSAFAALLTFALVERRARRMVAPCGAFIAAIVAALGSLDALHTGGGMSTFALAALALLLLEDATFASALALGALAIVWCNLEPAGLLAPAFALVSACARVLDRDAPEQRRFAWLGFGLAAVATLVGPLGLAFPARAFAALQLAGTGHEFALWSPIDIAPHAYRIGFLPLLLAVLAIGLRGRNIRDATLALFALLAALANGALVPLFGIVAAPIVVAGFFNRYASGAGGNDAGTTVVRRVGSIIVPSLAAALIATMVGMAVGARVVPLAPDQPYAALERLAHGGGVHRVFCANAAWCDGARAFGLAVVADSGIANASPATREADVRILQTRKTWRRDIDRLDIDTAIVRSNSALATLLVATRWRMYALAGKIAIFRRDVGRT